MAKKIKLTSKNTSGRDAETGLTQKQADWVELVLKGMDYTNAYKEVYKPKPSTSENAIRAAASRIRTKPAVAKALGEAKVKINTYQILWTKEMAIKELMSLLNKAKEELNYVPLNKTLSETILGSIKELNVIAGHSWKDQKAHEMALAKLEIERLNYELNKKTKLADPTEQELLEDDGFMEAMKGEVSKIWED